MQRLAKSFLPLLLFLVWPEQGLADGSGKSSCTVYVYIDSRGNTVRTRDYKSIPRSKRTSVLSYRDCSSDLGRGGSFGYVSEGSSEASPEWDSSSKSDSESKPSSFKRWVRCRKKRLRGFYAVLGVVCLATFIAGLIGVLVAAFRVHILWGLAVLFVPLAPLIFLIVHWDRARASVLTWLFGVAGCVVLAFLV